MAQLYLFKNRIETLFQLLGNNENDISYSVGWAFANCPIFLDSFLRKIGVRSPISREKIRIQLQEYEPKKGFTDFEIFQEQAFHIIIEAKRYNNFPKREQLVKYAKRRGFSGSDAAQKRIIIFNDSTDDYRKAEFLPRRIYGFDVTGVSWKDLKSLASKSIKQSRNAEKSILRDLIHYLEGVITMQRTASNEVFIVSIAKGNPPGWKVSWRDIVNIERRYFHPVGGSGVRWPWVPPNYIAFRYDGCLQSIHHIERWQVTKNPRSIFKKKASKKKWPRPHYVYELGPPIPCKRIRADIHRSAHTKASLDLLLTRSSIKQAVAFSRKRERSAVD